MPCYHPLKAFRTTTGVSFVEDRRRGDFLGDIELPCGQCIGCRMRRASDWSLRVMHEASCWPENCFITLTYGRDECPPNFSLDHRDFQLFMKRLRKAFPGRKIRFYMCGEYGPETQRPHYHACLFNVDFRADRVLQGKSASGESYFDSPQLAKLWGKGRVSVQDLNKKTASYCARYIMKKLLGQAAKDGYGDRAPEYAVMSKGIGAAWFQKYGRDVFPHDLCIDSEGRETRPPRFYDKLLARRKVQVEDHIKYAREQRAKLSAADNTDERRVVRETVHQARIRNLQRGNL